MLRSSVFSDRSTILPPKPLPWFHMQHEENIRKAAFIKEKSPAFCVWTLITSLLSEKAETDSHRATSPDCDIPQMSFLQHHYHLPILKHTPASPVLSILASLAVFWEWMGNRHDSTVLDTESPRKGISPALGWKHLTPYSHEERRKFWVFYLLRKSLFPFIKSFS